MGILSGYVLGKTRIEFITPGIVVDGEDVLEVVETKNNASLVVLFKKDSLGKGTPEIDIYTTAEQKVYHNGKILPARDYVNYSSVTFYPVPRRFKSYGIIMRYLTVLEIHGLQIETIDIKYHPMIHVRSKL